jgi:hypothetical protein
VIYEFPAGASLVQALNNEVGTVSSATSTQTVTLPTVGSGAGAVYFGALGMDAGQLAKTMSTAWTAPSGIVKDVDALVISNPDGYYLTLAWAQLAATSFAPTATTTASDSTFIAREAVSFAVTLPTGPVVRTGKAKVWDGTQWVSHPAKTWNGTAWVVHPIKAQTASGMVTAK